MIRFFVGFADEKTPTKTSKASSRAEGSGQNLRFCPAAIRARIPAMRVSIVKRSFTIG